MKHFILLLTLTLGLLSFENSNASTGIRGLVADAQGEPLLVATVTAFQKEKVVASTESDFDGLFYFKDLAPGTYDIEAAYVGYQAQRITGVVVMADSITKMEIVLHEGGLLEEAVILDYEVPLISISEKVRVLTSKDIESLPTKNIAQIATTSAGISQSGNISMRSSRSQATHYYIDGIRVNAVNAAHQIAQAKINVVDAIESKVHLPDAGQLTAGEWNDLKNWNTWNELIDTGVYQEMEIYWNRPQLERMSVFVTTANNIPLANQKVEVITGVGDILWTAMSDNSGSAELWLPQDILDYNLYVEDSKVALQNQLENDQDSHHLIIDEPCNSDQSLDVMFVVDVTSSMRDEIDYLRAELVNVIDRVGEELNDQDASLRLGTVFYKDHREIQPTAVSPLQEDLSVSFDFIQNQSIGSSTRNIDIPEAVELGLEEALAQDWNMSASNRLIFLVLDAPPRHNDTILTKINQQIKKAAAMGIKIIPVTASGIDRHTEYLMKQMAISTNGTYVFLTDDSGIGQKHLEHVVPDYEVELLNDMLVRIITGYAKNYDCESEFQDRSLVSDSSLSVFPNPFSGPITVTTDRQVDKIVVTSASGNRVLTRGNLEKEFQMDLSQLVSGVYQLSVYVGGQQVQTQNVIKI